MNATELRTKSVDELQKLLAEKQAELTGNKRSLAAGELPNPRVVTKTRREIARIMLCLGEAQNNEASKGDA